MSVQLSVSSRNARLDSIETTVGTAPKLRISSGAPPANCAAADTGTLLAELTLPSDWMDAAASGSKAKLGTWSGLGDAGAGAGTNAGHFRIKDSAGTNAHIQGTITATGGGGDMTLNNISIANGQDVTITAFTLTDGNA
jgi:hypothetical protein